MESLTLTPGNVAGSLRALGYPAAGVSAGSWRVAWDGAGAVRVDHPAAALPELHAAAELLRAAGWDAEVVQPDGWVRVAGARSAR